MQADVRRIGGYDGEALPTTAAELASRVLTTVYMGSENSSAETRERARRLAGEVGSHHLDVGIDPLVSALTSLFAATFGRRGAGCGGKLRGARGDWDGRG